jgi:hypothetical protein
MRRSPWASLPTSRTADPVHPVPIALRAGFGQDELSHGSERYRVSADRLVVVPPTVAVYLLNNAGFYVVSRPDPNPAPPPGVELPPQFLVRVRHPTAVGCSYGGCEYRRNQNGEFLVPATAVADLIGHGFVPVAPADRPIVMAPTAEQSKKLRGSLPAKYDEPQGSTL